LLTICAGFDILLFCAIETTTMMLMRLLAKQVLACAIFLSHWSILR